MIDDRTRKSLALVADTPLFGRRVTREVDAAVRLYRAPRATVVDKGAELTSPAILDWPTWACVT